MAFHRLTVPAYSGGLPAGYDYANNALSGVPALAKGVVTEGPNVGTYLVAFNEPAQSATVNRGLTAILANTDHLDDLLRQDIAIPTRTADATAPGGGVNNVSFGAGTFVGVSGTPNTTPGINTFVDILDTNDNEIIIASSGARCMVTSITGAVPGDGFSAGTVTFNISPTIPAGQAYRIYYGTRGNLATLPVDAFSNIKIRGAQELPAAFEDFQKMISRYSGNNVAALVGSAFETPDGVRLAKQASITFDADIDASVGSSSVARGFNFRIRKSSTPVTLMKFREILASEGGPYDYGYRYATERGPGNVVDWFDGTGAYTDAGILASYITSGGVSNSGAAIPYTGGAGATFPRVMEMPSQFDASASPMGYGSPQSIVSMLNARPFVTCGDGVQTFGDFNGASAVEDAFNFYLSNAGGYISSTGITIFVKPGNYTLIQTSAGLSAYSGEFKILGASREACVITVINSDGSSFGSAAGGTLVLENLTIKNDNAHTNGSLKIAGLLRMRNVTLSRHNVQFTNPVNAARATTPCCVMESCKIDLGSFGISDGRACIDLLVGDNASHTDFLFQDCTFLSQTGSPVMRIKATGSGINTTTVRRVHFRDCNLTMLSTTNSGAVLAANPGVLEIDANGSSGKLVVDDVLYDYCRVIANSGGTGTNAILAHIHGLARGSGASPTSTSLVGTIAIRGGTWTATAGSTGTAISPLFIASSNIIVTDTTFIGTGLKNGIAPSEAQYLINGIGGAVIPNIDWQSFVFAPGGLGVFNLLGANSNAPSLVMRNVAFAKFGRLTDSGDLGLYLPENGHIAGIQVSGYVDAGAGAVPNNRVVLASQRYNFGGIPTGSRMLIEGIQVTGINTTTSLHDFTTVATQQQGIMLLKAQGGLHLKRCTLRGFTTVGAATNCVGFAQWLPLTTDTPTPVTGAGYGLTLEDCEADFFSNGFTCIATTNGVVAARINIIRGKYNNNLQCGIFLAPYDVDHITVEGIEATGNTSYGIEAAPARWKGAINILNNRVHDNNGSVTATQIYIFGSSGQFPQGHCTGNNCMGDAAGGSFASYGHIEYVGNNVGVNGNVDYDHLGGFGGIPVLMRGLNTRIYVGASSVPTIEVGRIYTSGAVMEHNLALLTT